MRNFGHDLVGRVRCLLELGRLDLIFCKHCAVEGAVVRRFGEGVSVVSWPELDPGAREEVLWSS